METITQPAITAKEELVKPLADLPRFFRVLAAAIGVLMAHGMQRDGEPGEWTGSLEQQETLQRLRDALHDYLPRLPGEDSPWSF